MSDKAPRKEAKTLTSPDTTLVAPAPQRTEDPSYTLSEKKEHTYEDGSEKPNGGHASATPLIPAPPPPPLDTAGRGLYPAIPALRSATPGGGGDRAPRGRRGFFRQASDGNMASAAAAAAGDAASASQQQRAQEMQQLERRLQAQRRAGPTAAEAELRLMQLRYEALKATTARGPRVAQGVFRASCATDLCFVLDVTGSMQRYITAAKTQIRAIVQEIQSAFFGEADVRVAVVAYRDHCDDKLRLETLGFTADVDAVHDFLDRLYATGGGDTAEDVLGGLDAALALAWRHPTRCIMHIADAPAHGQSLHLMSPSTDNFHDETATPQPHGLQYRDVLARMVAREINYVFFRINTSTDTMVCAFMEEYAAAAPDARLCPQNRYSSALARADRLAAAKPSASASASTSPGDTFTSGALNGGLHFEEVMLGVSYSELSRLVVGGVAASSSRTAVRLTASTSASSSSRAGGSGLRSKRAYQKAKLGDVAEDAELEVLDEEAAEEADDKPEKQAAQGLDSATTHVGSAVTNTADGDAGNDDDDTGRRRRRRTAGVELETGPPRWSEKGWLDQTIQFKAFSPDVVNMQRLPTGGGGGSSSSSKKNAKATTERLLDRMIESDDNIPMSTTELTILRRSRPFAQGALRTASYARTQESTNPLVVKTFKRGDKRLADLAEDMRLQALCKAFALEFNTLVANEQYSLDFVVVTCLQPVHATVVSWDADDDGGDECMTLEPLLSTEDGDEADMGGGGGGGGRRYVKYNNNCGGVSRLGSQDPAGDGTDADADGEKKKKKPKKKTPKPTHANKDVQRQLRKAAKEQAQAEAKAAKAAEVKAKARAKEAKAFKASQAGQAAAAAAAAAAAETPAMQARRARRARLAALNAAAQAFSHFTFERARGRMLVVDLQGVGNVLTDPAIHTRDPTRFVLSDTNLNEDGFKLFFATHRCNFLCKHLRLRSDADMFRTGRFDFRSDWTLPASALGGGGPRAGLLGRAVDGVLRAVAWWDRLVALPSQQAAAAAAAADDSSCSSSPPAGGYGARRGTPPGMLVCCANKLCSRIVRVATAQAAPAGVFWCARCWPQLRSSAVMRVCATPGAYHEFEVSTFFFESQGQILPSTCTAHGGVVSQPLALAKERSPAVQRLSCF